MSYHCRGWAWWSSPFLGSSRAGCGFRPQNSTSAPSMVASPGVPPLLQLLLASGVCPAQGWACWKLSRRLLGGSVASLCSSSLRGVPEMALLRGVAGRWAQGRGGRHDLGGRQGGQLE